MTQTVKEWAAEWVKAQLKTSCFPQYDAPQLLSPEKCILAAAEYWGKKGFEAGTKVEAGMWIAPSLAKKWWQEVSGEKKEEPTK